MRQKNNSHSHWAHCVTSERERAATCAVKYQTVRSLYAANLLASTLWSTRGVILPSSKLIPAGSPCRGGDSACDRWSSREVSSRSPLYSWAAHCMMGMDHVTQWCYCCFCCCCWCPVTSATRHWQDASPKLVLVVTVHANCLSRFCSAFNCLSLSYDRYQFYRETFGDFKTSRVSFNYFSHRTRSKRIITFGY